MRWLRSRWIRFAAPAVLLACSALPAQAQFFSRKPKMQVSGGVPELLSASRTETDERKRISAIEQLREHDGKSNPDIVPALVDILLSDPKASVRLEAVNTLSRIRPVSDMAGRALEQAAHRDDSWRVRWQAKTSLWSYGLAGYRNGNSGNPNAAPKGSTAEPPLAEGTRIVIDPPSYPTTSLPPRTTTPPPVLLPSTPQPIPTAPVTVPQGSSVSLPRALPSRPEPGFSTAQPAPRRVPVPSTSDGPILVPVQ